MTTLAPRDIDTAEARQAIEAAVDGATEWAWKAERSGCPSGRDAARLVRGIAQTIEADAGKYMTKAAAAELGARALALCGLVRRLSL